MHASRRPVGVEALAVGATGLVVALAANGLSPRGLSLTRNYFPAAVIAPLTSAVARGEGPTSVAGAATGTAVVAPPVSTNITPTNALAVRLLGLGLQPVERAEVDRLFVDPMYAEERIVFVDARNDQYYREGHIPGAYQLDHYYATNYLPSVLPACLQAQTVLVYCNGGDCEDSEFAAITLIQQGVLQDSVRVYVGGMEEWIRSGRQIEIGERGSGNLKGVRP